MIITCEAEVTPGAKMYKSYVAAPCGMTVGEMPLNVMSPAVTIVMVPIANRVGSATEVATRVAVAFVGTVAGAVKSPLASIEPQAGLHVANWG